MSQSGDDDLWGDLSPSFEEQLYNNVALAEQAADLARQRNSLVHSPLRASLKETSLQSKTSSLIKENGFQVYRDPLPQSTNTTTSNRSSTPLRELSTNHKVDNTFNMAEKRIKVSDKESKASCTSAHPYDTRTTTTKDDAQCTPIPSKPHDPSKDTNNDEDDYMWMDFDVDFSELLQDLNSQELIQSPTNKEQHGKDTTPETTKNPDHYQDNAQVEYNLGRFGGFMTAGSKKNLNINSEARNKAIALFHDTAKSLQNDTTSPPSSSKHIKSTKDPIEQPSPSPPPPSTSAVNSTTATTTPAIAHDRTPEQGEKRALDEDQEPSPEFKYESILSEFGGFKMGSGRAGITVSAEAKRQAVALFNASETTRDLTQSQSPMRDSVSSQHGSSSNSSNSSGSPLSKMSYNDTNANAVNSSPSSPPLRKPRYAAPAINAITRANAPSSSSPPPRSPVPTITNESPKSLPVRRRRQPNIEPGKVRPFKSPIIKDKLEYTKAAVNNQSSSAIRGKGPSVFSLKAVGVRQSLGDLGLPQRYNVKELKEMDIPQDVIDISATTAKDYKFGLWGTMEARAEMIKAGALERLLPHAWVENHYGWIVWKIASMVCSYPQHFKSWWTPKKVMEQLLYRYEREINLGQRSALKRILEQDDSPGRQMILAVASISKVTTEGSRKYQLTLTDGWYQIPAVADPRMEHAISCGRLAVGYKLSICGAQLANPQQVPSSTGMTTLMISSNSCQIARWDAKLGYQKQRLRFRSLGTLHEYGGAVTALDIIVCRKYPMMYRELFKDGTVVIRNAREEEEMRHKYMADAHLGEYMPSFKEHPRALLSQHLGQHDGLLQGATPSKTTPTEERNVSGYFKLLVCDYTRSSGGGDDDATKQSTLATLLLLDANEVLYMDICEGHRYRVLFLTPYQPKKRRGCDVYLKSTRRTRWEPITCTLDETANTAYVPRCITSCNSLVDIDPSSDVDIAVIVLSVISVERYSQPGDRIVYHQKLLVTDQSKALVQIKLRIPIRPLSNIEGQAIAFTNVGYDMHDAKYGVTHVKTSDESEIITKQSSSIAYIHQALIRLREWKQKNVDELESLAQHVKSDILLT